MQHIRLTHIHGIIAALCAVFVATTLLCGTALADEVVYRDDEREDLDDPNATYVIRGDGPGEEHVHKSGNYFYVPGDKSSEENPLVIVLDNVNRTQAGCSPSNSFITIAANNYVVVKLRGTNTIVGGEKEGVGSNDGTAGIHVSQGATLKVTSEQGDGSTEGSLTVKGGGSKYGGAGIGTSYNHATGSVIIAGGTIDATGGHCAAGIGSGRDGEAYGLQITGGKVTAQGGEYAAGIGAGDNVGSGKGGDTYDITISGGTIDAKGGPNGAGIGCSEGGTLRGTILISGGNVTATGGHEGAGIGSGDGAEFSKDDKGLVKITGGTIDAKGGGNGAGIGGANGSDFINVQVDEAEGAGLSIKAQGGDNGAGIGSGAEDCDNVSIRLRGGTIEARGGSSGAGIGGANDPGVGTGGDAKVIEIYGTGTVNAYGGSNAAAIGGGYDNEVSDHITIEGDSWGQGNRGLTIVADSGGGTAAGIGSGSEDCGPISIKNASVKAWGDGSAADIGTGGNWGNGGKIDSVTIENCYIETKGKGKSGAGIGAGQGCECKSITIKGSECYGNAIGEGMGVYFKFWDNYGDMDSITIENSHIEATWDNATGSDGMKGSAAAGIGSCTLGSVRSISIDNSTVKAKGINGGAGIGSGGWGADNYLGFEYVGGEVGSISITDSTITAAGAEPGVQSNSGAPGPDLTHRPVVGGGAGIGGGGNTKCGTINISGSAVTATAGKYAAGIGGGGTESVDSVDISDTSNVTATGGMYGAGIGAGGSQSAVTQTVFHADVDTIKISDSTVTATGGKYAAGIGAGCGASMDTTTASGDDIDYNIRVSDSTINAQGGEGGAGIGGGTVGSYATGGHSGDILLEGKSHVTATGGRQGSGIGGGASSDFQGHGGCDNVEIDLQSSEDMPTHGTDPSSHSGWIVAQGGLGAAGIGAGGYLFHYSSHDPIPKTNDTKSVSIKGGYIVAKGGADDTDDAGIKTGSGAGIGGGAAGTKLKNLSITGGWVEAHAGNEHAAAIGHGGNTEGRDGADDASNKFYIYAGTVVADSFGASATKVIDGGSVTAKLTDAHNFAGTPVYQTTLKTISNTGNLHQVDVRPPYGYFGIRPIYNDKDYKVYLYLPESTENQQTAELYIPGWMDHMHYFGTTKADNSGWLKMDGEDVPFKDPGTVRYGDEFTLVLDDEDVVANTQWKNIEVTGAAELVEEGSQKTSPGMRLKLKANGVGSFAVSATAEGSSDPELFWCSKTSYSGTVEKAEPTIAFTEDLSKVYDGRPVTDPGVQTNSPGAVSYSYSTQDGTAPKDAGDYTVTATVEETNLCESASVTQDFTIQKAPTSLGLELSQEGSTGIATAIVGGLYEEDGLVSFTINGGGSSEPVPVVGSSVHIGDDASGKDVTVYTATISGFDLPVGEYTVVATYTGSNHEDSEASATGTKDRATPQIHHYSAMDETYESTGFNLNTEVRDGNETIDDKVTTTYEVVWDCYGGLGYEPSIALNEDISGGSFKINHAGKAMIKITATPKPGEENTYNTAVAYVPVSVAPASLTVTSYVRQKGEDLPAATNNKPNEISSVCEAKYGNLFGLESVLNYSGLISDRGDTPESFTHGHGTLSAAPLSPTMGATSDYHVRIVKNGPEITTDGGTRTGAFFSRDYSITYASEPFAVTKRSLAVKACDASGVYGGDEPEYAWDVCNKEGCDGLAAWDTKDTVFSTAPEVVRDGAEQTLYNTLAANTYEGVIKVLPAESPNYSIADADCIAGNLTVCPVSLSDGERFEVSVDNTVYNGSPQLQKVTVRDSVLGVELVEGESKDYTVTYASDDTTNAGRVWVVVRGHGNYDGLQPASYRIAKKLVTVETQSATKRYDGTPLTAPGTAEGILGDDAAFQATGTLTVPGSAWNSYSLDYKSDAVAADYRVYEKLGILRVQGNFLARCDMSQPDNVTYDGKEHKAVVQITDGDGNPLVEGTDYDLTYTSTAGNLTDAGTVTVTATGKGIYAFDRICISDQERDVSDEAKKELSAKSVTYVIQPAQLIVDTEDAKKAYDGTPLTAPGSVEGLVNGETATVRTTGSQTEVGSSKNTYELVWDGTAKEANYKVAHEDLGMLVVSEPAPGITYACVQGADGTWMQGSSEPLTFVYKRSEADEETFLHFTGVEVDGKALDAEAYDAKSGSLVVSLKPSYLQELSEGEHTLQPRFDDGTAQTTSFTVAAMDDASGDASKSTTSGGTTSTTKTVTGTTASAMPRTGDVLPAWLGLLCLIGLASAVLGVARRQ